MRTSVDPGQSTAQHVTVAVVEHVATREDVDPLDLPPLNDVIDPDALTALFEDPESAAHRVTFSYNGYEIVVEGPEQVQVTPLEDDRE